MMHVPLGDTYYTKFTTRSFSTGAPAQLAGTPVVDIYEENNLTQITGAETLTVDYDGVTGLNDLAIVCSTGNGFEVGKYYDAVITTGTVGGVSVVGEVVAHFRVMPAEDAGAGIPDVNTTHVSDTSQTGNDNGADINTLLTRIVGTLAAGTHNPQTGDSYAIVNSGTFGNAQLVRSTTPANTLDVAATGEAGIDLGNVTGTLTQANVGWVDSNSRVDVGSWLGTAVTTSSTSTKPEVDMFSISDDATAANNLELGASEIESGACEGTPSTTVIQTNLAETQDDIYIGRIVIFTSGNARGEATEITDYTGSTGTLTVTALANAPAASDTFIIV
jgi:hypothetical protein